MVIPTILEKTWEEIDAKFKIYESFTKSVHIDFIDGKFNNNPTVMDPSLFREYSTKFDLEAHLMVEEPINYLESLISAGFKIVLGHIEKMSNQAEFITKGEELGAVGLALDIATSVSDIKVSLENLDQILLMSIIAGASGRPFDQRVLPKIKQLKDQGFSNIEVDGGINDRTLPILKNAGASVFCVNSFLFKGDPEKQYRLLESLL